MFERFTERARQVIVLAQDEARRLKHNYIGTEHLLLGLIREKEGLAARTLVSSGVSLEPARKWVSRVIGEGDAAEAATGQIPFTPRMKAILDLTLREAVSMGHNYIGTEHLLMALLHEGEGAALHTMRDLGAPPEEVWASLFRQLAAKEPPPFSPLPAGAGRRELLHELWPPVLAGVGTFAVGLFVGWLIWG